MKRLPVILVGVVLVAGGSMNALAANPDIGGSPIYTEEDYFSAGDAKIWRLTVYSYVFDDTPGSQPGLFELNPGEMLFMYLLDCPVTSGTAIEHYSIGNPDLMVIKTVGFENTLVPDGYDAVNFDDP